jgi:hypothetical protein
MKRTPTRGHTVYPTYNEASGLHNPRKDGHYDDHLRSKKPCMLENFTLFDSM